MRTAGSMPGRRKARSSCSNRCNLAQHGHSYGIIGAMRKKRMTMLNKNKSVTEFPDVPTEKLVRTEIDPSLSQIVIKGDPCENEADDWDEA